MGLILFIVFGGFIGWLTGKITKGTGFGIFGNIAVGIAGSIIGKFSFGLLGLSAHTLIGEIVCSVLGAVALLYIVGKLKK